MGTYYSPLTGMTYSSKEQMEAMEKAYMGELAKKQANELKRANEISEQNNRANELAEMERMRQERENAEMIEQATRRAEENKHQNDIAIEQMRQQHDNEMRYNKLCDDMGMNYQDIVIFNEWLNHVSDKDYNTYSEIAKQHSKFLKPEKIQNLEREISKTEKEIISMKAELVDLEDLEDIEDLEDLEFWFDLEEVADLEDIEALDTIKNNTGIFSNFSFFSKNKKLKTEKELVEKILNKIKNRNATLNKEIIKLEKIIAEQRKDYDKLLQESEELLESDEKYQKMLPKFKEAQNALDGTYTTNRKKFEEFRRKHYNREVEMLLRKLEIKLDRISSDDIKETGTVDEYIEFIDEAIIELDKVVLLEDELSTDPLLMKAIDIVVEEGMVSVPFIEETFKIRRERAEKIIQEMIERGIMGEDFTIFMTKERWDDIKNG